MRTTARFSRLTRALIAGVGVALVASSTLWSAASVHAQQPNELGEPVVTITQQRVEIAVTENSTKVLVFPVWIEYVGGFDDTVVDVEPVTPQQIRLKAKSPGITTLTVLDKDGVSRLIDVIVEGDVRHLQTMINRMFPEAAVHVVRVGDGVVLKGWVNDPNHINEIYDIASQFDGKVLNHMRLGGVNQVQMRVKVMEVQRTRIRQLGLNFNYLGENGLISSSPGGVVPLSSFSLPFGGPPSATVLNGATQKASMVLGFAGDNSAFSAFLLALREEGLLKIKAESTVTSTSGRPATLLSGGEFPILIPQSLGTLSVEWREYGVRLEAVPIVLGSGRVRLEVAPEVSELDVSKSVTVSGTTIPGLTTRRMNTQVEMEFGQTLVMGGLISNRQVAQVEKIPFLGELPGIGVAFSRKKFDEVETELIIMVTPEFVAPADPHCLPGVGPGGLTDTPTDHELYFDGLLEVPYAAGGGNCPPGGGGHGYGGGYGACGDSCTSIAPAMGGSYGGNSQTVPQNLPAVSEPMTSAPAVVPPQPEGPVHGELPFMPGPFVPSVPGATENTSTVPEAPSASTRSRGFTSFASWQKPRISPAKSSTAAP